MILMFKRIIQISIVTNLLIFVPSNQASQSVEKSEEDVNYFDIERDEKPCSFYDTVNITDGVKNSDGSVSYEGITYLLDQYKSYDYIYKGPNVRKNVTSHLRGCICQHRICIRSCCPKGFVFDNKCIKSSNETFTDFSVAIEHHAGIHIFDLFSNKNDYALTYTKPCIGFLLEPHNDDNDKWMLVRRDNHVKLSLSHNDLTNDQYCILFDTDKTLHAIACDFSEDIEESPHRIFLPIGEFKVKFY